ncbi:ribbon-helix-helix protein [Rhizobium wenxiniae]|uniref:ribbon-helix-helix protein n=1 Tax=Rhizobium wenxiniae TaxID=1737357 RepID=UPI003C1827BA
MSERSSKRSFASRPADPESWVKAPDRPSPRTDPAAEFTARLTIDVTADMRGRIKIAAFQRGQTVADMLRALFEREFPTSEGEPR